MGSASNGQGDRPHPTLVEIALQGITRTTTQEIALWMRRHFVFRLRNLASDLHGDGRAAECARRRSAIVEVERLRRDSDEVQPSDLDAVLRSVVMAQSMP
jgi:hypothetical protein